MNTTLQTAIDELGLSIKAAFVPFSQSRNAKPNPKINDRSLNWRVTLVRDSRDILTTDYSAGIAHSPSYKQGKLTLNDAELIEYETEHGFKAQFAHNIATPLRGKPILPSTADVIHSLVVDADVMEYPSFESWALDFGYDTDSRSAEKIYQACLEIALKLRNGIGEAALTKLRDASQDY